MSRSVKPLWQEQKDDRLVQLNELSDSIKRVIKFPVDPKDLANELLLLGYRKQDLSSRQER